MKKDFVTIIEKSLQKIGIDAVPPIDVEVPPGENFGDLSTPVALALAKVLKKPPKKIADELASCMHEKTILERVDIAGPGFINITFTKEYLYKELRKLLESGSRFFP